jgi:serine/threonine-protein kinase
VSIDPDDLLGAPPRDDALHRRLVVAVAEARIFGGNPEPVRLGRFEVSSRLGAGGLGAVYAAHDPSLDRKVALKLLHGDARDDLLGEARAMARLSHPNVVTVFEVGTHDGQAFIAMELVDGWTLRSWIAHQQPRPGAVLDALVAAGRGLAAAHAAGLVHRDFKPENVLVGRDGRVRVSDFGLATTSHAATTAGTTCYMPPEQQVGHEVTAKSDQYAFCVTAWEALSGARPNEETRALPDVAGLPRATWHTLRRGLGREPGERWPSMDGLLDQLTRSTRRRRGRLVLVVVVVIAVAIALVAAFTQMWMFADWMGRARRDRPAVGE